jgi:hypothetical protein
MRMLSLILRTNFFELGQKYHFLSSFWAHLLVSTKIFKMFGVLGTLKFISKIHKLMRMLWPLCDCWAIEHTHHQAGTFAYDQCTHQLLMLMHALSIRVIGTHSCIEHTHKVLKQAFHRSWFLHNKVSMGGLRYFVVKFFFLYLGVHCTVPYAYADCSD